MEDLKQTSEALQEHSPISQTVQPFFLLFCSFINKLKRKTDVPQPGKPLQSFIMTIFFVKKKKKALLYV